MTSITRRPRMRLSKARLRVLRHQQAHKTRKARRELSLESATTLGVNLSVASPARP